MKKQTFYKAIVVPNRLAEAIYGLKLTKTKTHNLFHLLDLMMNYSNRKSGTFYAYESLSNKFLRELFSGHYKEVLDPLLANNIIECDGYYSVHFGKSYYYRIKSSFFTECQNIVNIKVKYKQKIRDNDSEVFLFENFKKFMEELKIPFTKLEKIAENQVQNISLKNCKINNQVEAKDNRGLCVFDGNKSYYINKIKALKKARYENKLLIQDDKSTYIMTEEAYCQMKKLNTKISYNYVLINLKNKNYYAKRNKTNTRFDHNITNMPKVLLKAIFDENNLVEIDAVSSQPTIAANHMKKKEIKSKFVDDTFSGGLYENIQKVLGLKSRDDAKRAFLRICYMNANYSTLQKNQLAKEYPELIEYSDRTKKLKGNNQYAIEMQLEEAKIFIDNILLKLLNIGYNVLSKHDSIICRKKDAEDVTSYIEKILGDLDFQCKLKVS